MDNTSIYNDNVDNDFEFIDFMDEANFDQFMELIRGEGADQDHHQFFYPNNWDISHLVLASANADATTNDSQLLVDDHRLRDFNGVPSFYEFDSFPHMNNIAEEQEGNVKSSVAAVTPATTPTKTTKRADRSRTLISERKRRGSMKEKLYALRSLVPNITKMDKASIIGDAIRYVQELQMKTNKLKAEIASLESSMNQNHPGPGQGEGQDATWISKITTNNIPPPIKQILQMEVFQVELREFHVRMVCNKREGVAALLYKALDSLGLHVQSSNLATVAGKYVFTFTLNVYDLQMDISLPNLKLWIASAFCNLGFHFVTLPSA